MQSLRFQNPPADATSATRAMAPTVSEVFTDTATDGAAVGYMLARLPKTDAPVLWVQDRLSRRESGRPYLAGMGVQRQIIMVDLSRAADVLWAMEDGLRCATLGAVIGEIWGDPAALDFTATKRLALRSEAAGTPCWLIRRAASANLSAARNRWRIASRPSAPHPHDTRAPGAARWSLDLFRSRHMKPGHWVAEYDASADRLSRVATSGDGTLDAGDGTPREHATG